MNPALRSTILVSEAGFHFLMTHSWLLIANAADMAYLETYPAASWDSNISNGLIRVYVYVRMAVGCKMESCLIKNNGGMTSASSTQEPDTGICQAGQWIKQCKFSELFLCIFLMGKGKGESLSIDWPHSIEFFKTVGKM